MTFFLIPVSTMIPGRMVPNPLLHKHGPTHKNISQSELLG